MLTPDDISSSLDDGNAFDQLKLFFESFKGELNIIDEAIDVNLQMAYFKFSRELEKKFTTEEIFEQAKEIDSDSISESQKKELIARLASIDNVKANRIIEKFAGDPPEALKHWTLLALQESKMLMQSKLLDQNQVFISTGLGGKGHKLRYFIVLLPETEVSFSEFHEKIIRSEFNFAFKKCDAEIEEITFSENMATIVTLVPMNVTLTNLFAQTIKECNQFGSFIKNNCIITNVKRLGKEEIFEFLSRTDLEEPNNENRKKENEESN